MAKPLQEISKTEFSKNYNVVKVLTDKLEIMEQLKTFKSNNQAVAFGVKKKHSLSIDEKFDLIMSEIKKINNRLDRNNIF
ncbi:MAG: hypothetical protein MJ201_01285 [Mycoplasmoidaceae bacterium]|nr:hypothetical protein [Mycoplasmoidaceae bacterium]